MSPDLLSFFTLFFRSVVVVVVSKKIIKFRFLNKKS